MYCARLNWEGRGPPSYFPRLAIYSYSLVTHEKIVCDPFQLP